MQHRKKIFYYTVLSVLLFSCGIEKKENNISTLKNPIKNSYASFFKIYKEDNFSALVTYLNTSKTDSVVYVLYKNEKPALPCKAYFIKTPVQSVACMSSVFIGALNNIQALNFITAVDNGDYIYNPIIQQKIKSNQIKQLAKAGQLDFEQTLLCAPQIIFTNSSGDAKKDFDARLLKANCTPIVFADYFESHPLARTEWVKAFALFFDKEQQADSVFLAIEKNYNQLKQSADTCIYKPSVFTEIKTGDVWFVAGGKSYVAQILKDAGARYIFGDNDKLETQSLNMEQVVSKAEKADYWLNLHYCNTLQDILKQDKRYEFFNAFKKKNLYNNNAIVNSFGGNAFWEYGLNRPDELLTDLIKIFHPTLQENYQLKYYKQLQ